MSESFHNEDEFQCLRFYIENTGSELSGILGGEFWTQLILQSGQRQPFIQDAIITMGALSKILKIGGVRTEASFAPRMDMTEDEVALQQLYLFALQQYHKFIRGTRAHLTAHEDDKRAILISCLLITCIERLQNHNQSALTQAKSGLKIMHEWIEEHARSEVLDETKLVERGWTIASVPGVLSPRPLVLEDDIIEQFRRLELSSLALNTPNLAQRWKFVREEEMAIRIMPPAFTDLKDARLYSDLILRRAYHFIRRTQRATSHVKPVLSLSYSDEEHPITEDPEPLGLSRLSLEEFGAEQQMHASDNQKWSNAFQHFFRHLNKSLSESHPDLLCATLLRIRSLALRIRLAAAISASEMVYDEFLPEFKMIISLARPMVESPENFTEGSFCFDQSFIFELSLVAFHCRDRALRREALELLESKDWREGTWGSKRVADGFKVLLEIEEEGIDDELLPESARARLVSVDVNVEKHEALIQCIQGVGAEAIRRSSVRDWSSFY